LNNLEEPTRDEIDSKQYRELSLEVDECYEENYFCDFEIMNNVRCQVTIIAYTPCELISIARSDFAVLRVE
jgi:hypothetical protein